jgi:hypothetical protein
MTLQSSPLSRFRRAVSGTSATNALAAAAELGTLDLDDALRLVLLLNEDREKAAFGRYAVRWTSRYCNSTDGLDLAGAHAPIAALNRLPESSSLEALLRARGQRELAGVVTGPAFTRPELA